MFWLTGKNMQMHTNHSPTDDTSVIITRSDKLEFKRVLSCVLGDIVVWCKKNYLTLNLNKTQFIQFYTNHHKNLDIRVEIADAIIPTNNNVKFLGLILENGLSWKAYNSELTIKLNKACYAIRAVNLSYPSRLLLLSILHIFIPC